MTTVSLSVCSLFISTLVRFLKLNMLFYHKLRFHINSFLGEIFLKQLHVDVLKYQWHGILLGQDFFSHLKIYNDFMSPNTMYIVKKKSLFQIYIKMMTKQYQKN